MVGNGNGDVSVYLYDVGAVALHQFSSIMIGMSNVELWSCGFRSDHEIFQISFSFLKHPH